MTTDRSTSCILETKTKIGSTVVIDPDPRTNSNIDDVSTVPKPHTHPSHPETPRPSTPSSSLGSTSSSIFPFENPKEIATGTREALAGGPTATSRTCSFIGMFREPKPASKRRGKIKMVWKKSDWVILLFATAALPAGQAFGTDSMVMKASVRLTSLQMCGSTGEKAKKTALSNGVALLSALCIGSSAGPLASRARDLSDGAVPTVSGDKGINLGYVLHPDIQKDIQKDEEPHRKAIIAVGAGAAGTKFFSEIFLLNSENICILGVILYSTLFFKG